MRPDSDQVELNQYQGLISSFVKIYVRNNWRMRQSRQSVAHSGKPEKNNDYDFIGRQCAECSSCDSLTINIDATSY